MVLLVLTVTCEYLKRHRGGSVLYLRITSTYARGTQTYAPLPLLGERWGYDWCDARTISKKVFVPNRLSAIAFRPNFPKCLGVTPYRLFSFFSFRFSTIFLPKKVFTNPFGLVKSRFLLLTCYRLYIILWILSQ